jgi:hypothetical protein
MEFQHHLETLRMQFSKPMRLTSASRCSAYNQTPDIGGTKNGPHTMGAVDVMVYSSDAYWLIKLAMNLGWHGVGVKQTGIAVARFVHLDRRLHETIWSYT